jgi:hypothetical protein
MLQMGTLMKPLMQFGLCCLLAPGLFAAHEGGGPVGGGHAAGGHAGAATASHNAVHPRGSVRTSGYGRRGYGYVGLYGGYYDPFYDSGYYPPADPGGPNLAYAPLAPAVTIVETPHSVIHEYTTSADYGAPPERQNQPLLYLIAFRDSTIHAAMTYWVADGSLHYLDSDHKEKQAPLGSVDRDLSAQLNRERHVPFNLQ